MENKLLERRKKQTNELTKRERKKEIKKERTLSTEN